MTTLNHVGGIIHHHDPGWGGMVRRMVPTTSVSVVPIGRGMHESDTCLLCARGKPETMAIQNWYTISTQYRKTKVYTKIKRTREMKEVRMLWTQMIKKASPHRAMVDILHRGTRILGKMLMIVMTVQFHFETRHYGRALITSPSEH